MKTIFQTSLSSITMAIIISLLLVITGCVLRTGEEVIKERPEKTYKILHIMSYHSPWKWTDDQFQGFNDALKGINVEYMVFQMDTKRKSSEEWKQKVGKEARDLIDSWQPDLVYTNDDNAQEYVAKYYADSSIPFVFSAVNADPSKYGFDRSTNVAGIIEQEHFVESVNLLRELAPKTRKVAVIIDEDPTWPPVIERMKAKLNQIPDMEFTSWDTITLWDDYKRKIGELQDKVDAIALLGIFTYLDKDGRNIPYQEVLEWTTKNSNLPDFSFWEDRISYGTLCAMTVSGYEQGLEAGKIAKGILIEGRPPGSFGFKPTIKGDPVVSLARANKLNMIIPPNVISNAKIINEFEWDKEQKG